MIRKARCNGSNEPQDTVAITGMTLRLATRDGGGKSLASSCSKQNQANPFDEAQLTKQQGGTALKSRHFNASQDASPCPTDIPLAAMAEMTDLPMIQLLNSTTKEMEWLSSRSLGIVQPPGAPGKHAVDIRPTPVPHVICKRLQHALAVGLRDYACVRTCTGTLRIVPQMEICVSCQAPICPATPRRPMTMSFFSSKFPKLSIEALNNWHTSAAARKIG